MAKHCHVQEDAFSIRIDAGEKLFVIELSGFWDIETVERFGSAIAVALRAMKTAGCRPGEHVALVDNTRLNVQSQDVVQRFEDLIASRLNTARRVAVIVSSTLLKMQAKRVGPNHQFFEDRDAATRWLMESID
jgi:hypothetical protein